MLNCNELNFDANYFLKAAKSFRKQWEDSLAQKEGEVLP